MSSYTTRTKTWLIRTMERIRRANSHPDRGDVPGWVLVTLMTCGIVIVLWAVAGPLLVSVFEDAIGRVSN